jgi:hypothetical protein
VSLVQRVSSLGLCVENVKGDGNCLFRALARLTGYTGGHRALRRAVAAWLEGPGANFQFDLRDPTTRLQHYLAEVSTPPVSFSPNRSLCIDETTHMVPRPRSAGGPGLERLLPPRGAGSRMGGPHRAHCGGPCAGEAHPHLLLDSQPGRAGLLPLGRWTLPRPPSHRSRRRGPLRCAPTRGEKPRRKRRFDKALRICIRKLRSPWLVVSLSCHDSSLPDHGECVVVLFVAGAARCGGWSGGG